MDQAKKRVRFGEGPWLKEPDEGMWEAHGFRCMFVRNSSVGTLCGYVGVPKGHPWFEQHYDTVQREWNPDVHGGLTFSDEMSERSPDGLWYLGFDCAHLDDLMPMNIGFMEQGIFPRSKVEGVYKTVAWVKAETERLAEQAAKAAK